MIFAELSTELIPPNFTDPDDLFEILKKTVSSYHPSNDLEMINKAYALAKDAHKDQKRKSGEPYLIHPVCVAIILAQLEMDKETIVGGLLHDVVEDTKYTIDDIKNEFGNEIAELVMSASEPDKSLSWEERKTHTIEETKKLPLRNKLVICADKINNLEDLMLKFQKNGKRDFSSFKRGEKQQKWYYTNVYKSLIYNENDNLPILKRLKNVLDIVFYDKEDLYLKNTIFDDNKEYYEKLKKLHAQKLELQKLKALSPLSKPFVIEFSGTPRTGKTTTINNLYDFFKKGGFKISLLEEFTTSKYYKEIFKKKYSDVSSTESNIAIIEEVTNQLEKALDSDVDIILVDRSINDRQIWNYRRYLRGNMPEEIYKQAKEKYSLISQKLIDILVITYTDSLTALKRDYTSSLALEKRRFLNIDNLNEYNKSLNDLNELLKTTVKDFIFLDTTFIGTNDVSIEIASQIMTVLRKRYIENFKLKYSLK